MGSFPLLLPLVLDLQCFIEIHLSRSTWVARVIGHPTLDLAWGHDVRVMRCSPMSGSALSVEPA